MLRRGFVAGLTALAFASPAAADNWYPHPLDATWTYQWTDSAYAKTPTNEKITVKENVGLSFMLEWTTDGLDNPKEAITSKGTVTLHDTNAGLLASDWSSTPPPPYFPILCAQANGCPNAL